MFFQGGDAKFVISIAKYVKNRNFHIKKTKSFKTYLHVSKLSGKFQKLKKKTQTQGENSSFGRISPRLRDQVVL